jgi:hypothetical protein
MYMASIISPTWPFDLNHVGTHIAEQHCAKRARDVRGEINDSNIF